MKSIFWFLTIVPLLVSISCQKEDESVTGSNDVYYSTTTVTVFNYDPVIYQLYKDGGASITMGAANSVGDFTLASIAFTGSFTAINQHDSHSIDVRRNGNILDVFSASVYASDEDRIVTIFIQNGRFTKDLNF